ncbi:MAG: nucleoside-diphosphate kinase [Planctomycetes bacterium]|nr:nucleoside-diphosphate kinase [Planctomycetota bacterium]
MERTLVFLKPDAVRRRLVGRIIARFEDKGFNILALKMVQLGQEWVRAHYAEHEGKHFYEPLVRYITGGPVVALVLEGKNAVEAVRRMLGQTFGSTAAPGTIRGDFALSDRFNAVHASADVEAVQEEIERFFRPEELCECPEDATRWIYDQSGAAPV